MLKKKGCIWERIKRQDENVRFFARAGFPMLAMMSFNCESWTAFPCPPLPETVPFAGVLEGVATRVEALPSVALNLRIRQIYVILKVSPYISKKILDDDYNLTDQDEIRNHRSSYTQPTQQVSKKNIQLNNIFAKLCFLKRTYWIKWKSKNFFEEQLIYKLVANKLNKKLIRNTHCCAPSLINGSCGKKFAPSLVDPAPLFIRDKSCISWLWSKLLNADNSFSLELKAASAPPSDIFLSPPARPLCRGAGGLLSISFTYNELVLSNWYSQHRFGKILTQRPGSFVQKIFLSSKTVPLNQ